MKWALLSDIHANIQALDACENHARRQGVEPGAMGLAQQPHQLAPQVGLAGVADASGLGGAGAPVAVTTSAGCPWTATTATPWITVTSGASGTGLVGMSSLARLIPSGLAWSLSVLVRR